MDKRDDGLTEQKIEWTCRVNEKSLLSDWFELSLQFGIVAHLLTGCSEHVNNVPDTIQLVLCVQMCMWPFLNHQINYTAHIVLAQCDWFLWLLQQTMPIHASFHAPHTHICTTMYHRQHFVVLYFDTDDTMECKNWNSIKWIYSCILCGYCKMWSVRIPNGCFLPLKTAPRKRNSVNKHIYSCTIKTHKMRAQTERKVKAKRLAEGASSKIVSAATS